MKKRGFTLAEVLITLGIIGVVAALTAPSLVMNSRNESNAAKLAVTMSNLENAFTNAIVQEDVDNILKTRMWVSKSGDDGATSIDIPKFVGNLNRYIHLNGYYEMSATDFYEGTGPYEMTATGGKGALNAATMDGGANHFVVYTKSGAVLFMCPSVQGDQPQGAAKTRDAVADLGGSLYLRAMDLFIDVNGKASPNTYGRDIFRFYVGSDGILYPYGGLDASIFDAGGPNRLWNMDTSESGAGQSAKCLDSKIVGGLGCTARIIAEGYKINY